MSILKRREAPLILTAFVGFLMLFEYYVIVKPIGDFAVHVRNWAVILATFALGVGAINLMVVWVRDIKGRKGRWYLNIWGMIMFLAMLVTGLLGPVIATHPSFTWIYNNVNLALDPTMYSLNAFFIVSAAYRAFRTRSKEAAVLLLAGCLVMLMNAPIGAVIWPGFPVVGTWIMNVPNTAGFRAILIGAAIGLVATGLRTLLGRERGYLAGG